MAADACYSLTGIAILRLSVFDEVYFYMQEM
jgi:hypothetical protein